MKRLTIMLLAVLLCGAAVLTSSHSITAEPKAEPPETIHYADISGDYVFVANLSETERMLHSLRDYLGDDSIEIQTAVPDDAVRYAERTWDPSKAVLLSGGPVYCVEAWDVFKNGEFQKTTYLAGRI